MAKFKRNNLQLKTNQKIQLGDNQQSVVQYDGTDLKLTNAGGELTLDANGIALNSGVSINQFSNDSALGYGIDVVPTQNAVKTYVDTKVDLGMETGNLELSTGDTTAEVVFVQQQGSSYYSIGYSIINTVDNPPLLFVSGVFEKTFSGFKVMFSSPMDTDNYELSWIVSDMLFGSSSSSRSSSSRSSSSSKSSSSSSLSYGLPSELTFLLHASGSGDAEGVLLEVPDSQETFDDQGLSYIYRSTMLSDGRVVLPCYDGNGPVIVKCYEAGSLTTESWSTSITGSSLYYFVDVSILNDGNLVFAWVDYDDDVPYFAILSPAGAIVVGMTDARGGGGSLYEGDADYNVIVVPLEDGGFLLTWKFYSYNETAASLWEANGTNREPASDFFGGDDEAVNAETAQMLTDASPTYYSGLFPIFDALNGYGFWYNVTDLGEEWDYEGFDYYGDFTICRVLPQWAADNDSKMAVFISDGDVLGTIVKDNDDFEFERKTLLSGTYILNSVTVLPDDTFLVQATSTVDYGLNYWIFDDNLDLVSGPTAAFTGLTSDNLTNMKGGSQGAAPSLSSSSSSRSSSSSSSSSTSSSSTSISSSSTSSSSESAGPASWVSYFDDTIWDQVFATGTWTGSQWDSGIGRGSTNRIWISPLNSVYSPVSGAGGWEVGFRPTKIRITYDTGIPVSVAMSDNLTSIASVNPYNSGDEITIAWATQDLWSLSLTNTGTNPPFSITNIEFFGG